MTQEFDQELDVAEVVNLDELEATTFCACAAGDDVPWPGQ